MLQRRGICIWVKKYIESSLKMVDTEYELLVVYIKKIGKLKSSKS